MFLELSAPISLQWELTDWCNYKCLHCYNYWRSQGQCALKITPRHLEIYATTAQEILRNGILDVTLTGGEPLAVLKQAYPFLRQLSENGVQLSLNSNLSMLTPNIAAKLQELQIENILVSLPAGNSQMNDAITSFSGAHEKTVKGINLALESGFWVAVNMVVTKVNLSEIYSTAEYVKSLGVENFSATKAASPANCSDFSLYRLSPQEFNFMLEELIRVKNDLGLNVDSLEFYPPCSFESAQARSEFGAKMCTAGKITCTVGFNGEIRPCSHAPMDYGHIFNGLDIAWQNLSPWRTNEFLPSQCSECKMQTVCGGGCKTEAYVESGSLYEPDPFCKILIPEIKHSGDTMHKPIGDTFVFAPILRYRQEHFGGLIYLTPRKWITCTNELLGFAQERKGKIFTTEELASALGVKAKAVQPTLAQLLAKNIIKEVENGRCS